MYTKIFNNSKCYLTTTLLDIFIDLDNELYDLNGMLYYIQILLKQKIDLLYLHFNFIPNMDGYKLAKEDFLEKTIIQLSNQKN
jgi:hypothetical protein